MRPPQAFTLVELLVVMTIIAILAVVALVDYGTSVKKARLQIATEQVVVLLENAGVSAQTNIEAETQSNCWAVLLEAATEPSLYKIPYDDGCDTSVSNFEEDQSLNWVNQLAINELTYVTTDSYGTAGGGTLSSIWIVFAPPDGDISVYENGLSTISRISDVTEVEVPISFDGSEDPVFNKTITIVPITSSFVISSG